MTPLYTGIIFGLACAAARGLIQFYRRWHVWRTQCHKMWQQVEDAQREEIKQ